MKIGNKRPKVDERGSFTFHHDENISTHNPDLFFDNKGVVNTELNRMAGQRQTVLNQTKNKETDNAAFANYDTVELSMIQPEIEKSIWEVGWGHAAAYSQDTWDGLKYRPGSYEEGALKEIANVKVKEWFNI
jgi:hypothetical protein